jgi:thioredoxin 1
MAGRYMGRTRVVLLAIVSLLLLPGASVASAAPLVTTDADFDTQVLASATPVLVGFTADWCGPCRVQAAVLSDVADTSSGSLTVARLNVDENPLTAARFGVTSLPTVIVFKGGLAVGRAVGPRSRQQLLDLVARPAGGAERRTTPLQIVDARFRPDVLDSATPTLLVFTATWCGPCRLMLPELDRLAAETAGVLTVGWLDVDTSPHVPGALAISSLPAAVLIQDGRLVAQFDGRKSALELKAALSVYVDGLS